MDGVICPSRSKCLEFCNTVPINDCELDGAFELMLAECGDGEPLLFGRQFDITEPHGCISNAELTLAGIGSV